MDGKKATNMSEKLQNQSPETRSRKKEYMRKYYADNKDKWDEYRRRYWEKRLNEERQDDAAGT